MPGRFTSEKQLNRRLGWPQRRSGRFGEEKDSLHLQGFEHPTVQSTPVSVPFYRKQKRYYCVHKKSPIHSDLSQINRVHGHYELDFKYQFYR
jgi:hypothetical protein